MYRRVLIGSNGCLTFNTTGVGTTSEGFCEFGTLETIVLPNPNFPSQSYPILNTIFGVYQDHDFRSRNPLISGINYYSIDTGRYAAPNRVFIINFNQLPTYPASESGEVGLQTSQIVLHESTNIIEVNVKRRVPFMNWQGGRGLIGIQDASGINATVPHERNLGAWSAENESYRFMPNGISLPTVCTWSANGNYVGTNSPLNTCPDTATTYYTAQVSYAMTNGSIQNVSQSYVLEIGQFLVSEPQDIAICSTEAASYTVDLTSNEAVLIGINNPQDYLFSYWTSLQSASTGFGAGRILMPTAYVFNGTPQTIYLRIEDALGTGCQSIKPFQISVIQAAPTPVGSSLQYFSNGQTLNDLAVTGNNIVWYDALIGGNVLPGTTLLQNGVTYYAESTNANGCQGKMFAERLAVTVQSLLTAQNFEDTFLKVYPNPVTNILTVSYPEKLESIQIYNAVGQVVLQKNVSKTEVQTDLSQLTAGVYFVKISAGNKVKTIKILKK
ncbi:hypothetical protein FNO01nite_24640 [Flavobacterium noncentrifugens]|nr:hypothetical protein FNO01nite_24640 [Flavobacterium noncentrifugens]